MNGFDGFKTRKRFTRLEGLAMFGGEAILIDGFDVGFSAVADVVVESVFWVFFGKFNHIVISSDFGDDGGGRDFANFIVAFDAGGGEFF